MHFLTRLNNQVLLLNLKANFVPIEMNLMYYITMVKDGHLFIMLEFVLDVANLMPISVWNFMFRTTPVAHVAINWKILNITFYIALISWTYEQSYYILFPNLFSLQLAFCYMVILVLLQIKISWSLVLYTNLLKSLTDLINIVHNTLPPCRPFHTPLAAAIGSSRYAKDLEIVAKLWSIA